MRYLIYWLFVFILASCADLTAQDLVFTFKSPSFGGEAFVGQYLLAEAQAQDKFKEKVETSSFKQNDPLTDFTNSMNRQILTQLSRKLVQSAFGEGELKDGHYEYGDYQIDVSTTGEGIKILIIDQSTGGETTIMVPFY